MDLPHSPLPGLPDHIRFLRTQRWDVDSVRIPAPLSGFLPCSSRKMGGGFLLPGLGSGLWKVWPTGWRLNRFHASDAEDEGVRVSLLGQHRWNRGDP